MVRRSVSLVLVALVSLFVASCSGGELAEQILEGQEGVGDVEIDENDGSVSIDVEGENGGSIVVGGGDVPEEIPIDMAPGGQVVSAISAEGTYSVTLTYPGGEFESVTSHFESEIAAQGFDASTVSESGESMSWFAERGESESLAVIVQGGEEVIVTVTYDMGTS